MSRIALQRERTEEIRRNGRETSDASPVYEDLQPPLSSPDAIHGYLPFRVTCWTRHHENPRLRQQ
jgi:hypothetical protein